MNPWLAFAIGLVVGACFGLVIVSLLVAAKHGDELMQNDVRDLDLPTERQGPTDGNGVS